MKEVSPQTTDQATVRPPLSDRISERAWKVYLRLRVHPSSQTFGIRGYLHPHEGRFLYWLAGQIPIGGLALEVGSFMGKSGSFIAEGLPRSGQLVCVDTWANDAMPYDAPLDTYPEFLSNVAPYLDRIKPVRSQSEDLASRWDRPIDMLFIDGDHSYEGCRRDCLSWMGFVRSGGWIAFHDSGQEGVKRTIHECLPGSMRKCEVRVWSIFAAKVR